MKEASTLTWIASAERAIRHAWIETVLTPSLGAQSSSLANCIDKLKTASAGLVAHGCNIEPLWIVVFAVQAGDASATEHTFATILLKYLWLPGAAKCEVAEAAPADSPISVTCDGSPPNDSEETQFFIHHRNIFSFFFILEPPAGCLLTNVLVYPLQRCLLIQ